MLSDDNAKRQKIIKFLKDCGEKRNNIVHQNIEFIKDVDSKMFSYLYGLIRRYIYFIYSNLNKLPTMEALEKEIKIRKLQHEVGSAKKSRLKKCKPCPRWLRDWFLERL